VTPPPPIIPRICAILVVASLFGLSGCGVKPPTRPIESALEGREIGIPQLSLSMLPGDEFAPWRPQAWKLDVWRLSDNTGEKQASAEAWLGWTDEAFHIAVSVREPTRSVAGLDRPVYTGDSVEIAINTEPDYSGCWQVGISPPSLDAPARAQVFDYRKNEEHEVDFSYKISKSFDGYSMEIIVPWEHLPVEFKGPATKLYLLTNINNETRGGYERLRLPLLTGDRDAINWVPVQLMGRPGPPVPVAAWLGVRNLVELTLQAEVRPVISSQTFTARNDDRELGTMIWSSGTTPPRLSLPLTDLTVEEEAQPIRIFVDDILCGIALPPDLDRTRSEILFTEMPTWGAFLKPGETRGEHEWARLEMSHHVVMMDMFPTAEFNEPEKVRALLGREYEIDTTFYDEEGSAVDRPWHPGAYGAISKVDTGDGKDREVRHLIYRIGDSDPIPMTSDEETAFQLLAEDRLGRPWQDTDRTPEEIALFWWHELDKGRGVAKPLPYFVWEPKNRPEGPLPLLLFLHGSGARDLDQLERDSTIRAIRKSGFPGLVVVPFEEKPPWNPAKVGELLREVEAKYDVDPTRIYLTGFSRGGSGTWQVASAFPKKFAAIWPVAGAGIPELGRAWSRLRDLPTFVVWGEDDDLEAAEQAEAIVEMQQKLGVDSRFVLLPEAGHMDSFREAYRTPEIYEWLLEQSRPPRPKGPILP